MYESNLHHIHWTRAEHNRYTLSKRIRDHDLSKLTMYVPVHNELHSYVPPVKAPSAEIARTVLHLLNDMPGFYTPIDASKALRDELYDTDGDYLSTHLDRQIPFMELSKKALARRRL